MINDFEETGAESTPVSEEVVIKDNSIEIFVCSDKYYVLVFDHRLKKKKLLAGLTATTARTHWTKAGKDKTHFNNALVVVHDVKYEVDFLEPTSYKIKTDFEIGEVILIVKTNPTENWSSEPNFNKEIVAEFKEKIFKGQLDDLIELVILSIKFREAKLNKILITGASNKGKTGVFRLMNFFEVSSLTFKQGLEGTKGWGKEQMKALSLCGLMLVDDIDHTPSLEFKSITDTIEILVNHKGRPSLPMKFLAMTSTHSSVFDGAGDEILNRVLYMALGDEFIFDDSELWRKDPDTYKLHTSRYIRYKMLQVLNKEYSRSHLTTLQEKYRMSSDNLLSEIIYDVILATYKAFKPDDGYISGSRIEVVIPSTGTHAGIQFAKTIDVRTFVKEIMTEKARGIPIDFKKYENDIVNSILAGDRTHIEVNGVRQKLYKITPEAKNKMLKKYS